MWICRGGRSEREVGYGSHQHAAYGPTLARGHEDSLERLLDDHADDASSRGQTGAVSSRLG